jgi:hypothetical protein
MLLADKKTKTKSGNKRGGQKPWQKEILITHRALVWKAGINVVPAKVTFL